MWTVKPFDLPRLLLCEGKDDAEFFRGLIDVRNLPHFHISDTSTQEASQGGNTGFRRALIAARNNDNYYSRIRNILVVSDNDDPATSFDKVCDQVERAGFPKPTARLTPTTPSADRPRLPVMMLPLDPDEEGNLECTCVPATMSVRDSVSQAIRTFDANLHAEDWTPSRRGKLWLRAYLAATCERDPFVYLSKAFREHADLIPLDHPSFTPIADVLASLV